MSYDFRCVNAGAPTCSGRVKAATEEELRDKLAQHLTRHGVTVPNATLLDYLVSVATTSATSAPPHA